MSIAFVSGVSGFNLTNKRRLRRAGTTVPSSEARLIQDNETENEKETEMELLKKQNRAQLEYIFRMMQAQRSLTKSVENYKEVVTKIEAAVPMAQNLSEAGFKLGPDFAERLDQIERVAQEIKDDTQNIPEIKENTQKIKKDIKKDTKSGCIHGLLYAVMYTLIFAIMGKLLEMFVTHSFGLKGEQDIFNTGYSISLDLFNEEIVRMLAFVFILWCVTFAWKCLCVKENCLCHNCCWVKKGKGCVEDCFGKCPRVQKQLTCGAFSCNGYC